MSRFELGAGSIKELHGVHPWLAEVVRIAIDVTEQDFAVHDGLRTEAEQARYVARGVSRTMNSKHRVQSDGYGHAVDLVPFINGKLRWEWAPIHVIAVAMQEAVATVNARRSASHAKFRLIWGGVWDRPFENLGRTPGDFKKAVDAYVDRRRAIGKSAFIDGPHFEMAS